MVQGEKRKPAKCCEPVGKGGAMRDISQWVWARAKEPSSWAALAAIAGALGQVQVAAVASALGVALRESAHE